MPGLAHGKMYKRATFGASCPFAPESCGDCKDYFKTATTENRNEMKKDEKDVRRHFVKTRMNDSELDQLLKLQQKTTEKDVSSYLRKVALQNPVTVKYRNQSADDFLKEMLPLKKELNAIGNNLNQAVHKLHILEKIPEFRAWINQYDGLHKNLIKKVEEIKSKVAQLYEQWLQK